MMVRVIVVTRASDVKFSGFGMTMNLKRMRILSQIVVKIAL